LWRQEELPRRGQEPQEPFGGDPLQGVGEADGFGHGDPLRLHADGPIGDDPRLGRAGLAALGNQRGGAFGISAGRALGVAKISGMGNVQFLFDSFARKT
jgi:hypothetical protein